MTKFYIDNNPYNYTPSAVWLQVWILRKEKTIFFMLLLKNEDEYHRRESENQILEREMQTENNGLSFSSSPYPLLFPPEKNPNQTRSQ